MAMFDYYRPAGEKRCPSCQRVLREWQGKDGPNGMFVWAEGLGAPVDHLVDEECQASIAERQRLVLPPKFIIYSYDCPDHKPVEAVCRAIDGVWSSTEMQSK
jgi:hypothetical protein